MQQEKAMSVAKIVEITARSPESFEDAIRRGLERASRNIENIQGAWVHEQQVKFDGKRITDFQVNLKVTFVLNE
jgi:hypothetical protein